MCSTRAAHPRPTRSRVTMLLLLASCLGACAQGVDDGSAGLGSSGNTAVMFEDSGAGSNASGALDYPADAGTSDRSLDASGSTSADSGALDARTGDAGAATRDAGTATRDAGAITNVPVDAGMPAVVDSGLARDSGTAMHPDAATGADAGSVNAGQAPLSCAKIVGSGVMLCDMGADYCGAMFTNTGGCTATCAMAGLACATAYDNVEGQCARDEARPTLPCDSGHESDYCLCRQK